MGTDTMAILEYEWTFGHQRQNSLRKNLISKVATFNGEKVFRIEVKFSPNRFHPVVYFISTGLHRVGLQIHEVVLSVKHDKKTSVNMLEQTAKDSKTLQIFTYDDEARCRFQSPMQKLHFGIRIKSQSEDFSYQLSDASLKNDLWEVCSKGLYSPDVVFETVDCNIKFPAHKAILAARSSVLASMFEEASEKRSTMTIRLETMNPTAIGQFLKFLYTGAFEGSLASKDLLKLSKIFKIRALENSCKRALENLDLRDIAYLMSSIDDDISINNYSYTDGPVKTTHDHGESVLHQNANTVICTFKWHVTNLPAFNSTLVSEVFSFQEQPLCVAVLQCGNAHRTYTVGLVSSHDLYSYEIESSEFNYSETSILHDEQIGDLYPGRSNWLELELKKENTNSGGRRSFWTTWVKSGANISGSNYHDCLYFRVSITATKQHYSYSMMDVNWSKNILDSCLGPFTDIEVICDGEVRYFAHRFVLALRSPVFQALPGHACPKQKAKIRINDVEPFVVSDFLKFLYTGALPQAALKEKKQLKRLAVKYKVDSLNGYLDAQVDFPSDDDIVLSVLSINS